MGRKINKSDRKAAHMGLVLAMSQMDQVNHLLSEVCSAMGVGDGLTRGEQEYISKLRKDLHSRRNTIQKLAWRMREASR